MMHENQGNGMSHQKLYVNQKLHHVLKEKHISFLLRSCLLRGAKMPPSKFEANPTLHQRVNMLLFFVYISVFVLERVLRDN